MQAGVALAEEIVLQALTYVGFSAANLANATMLEVLREEGVNYQQLLDRVREDLACWWLLHSDLTVETIADRLGYQDTSNFSRTFRRWLGVTPRAFRDAQQEPVKAQ